MAKLVIAFLLALLAAALWYAYGLWTTVGSSGSVPSAPMPAGLYVAMVLGVVFSLIVGCGLMALVFYSSRAGYDERASGNDQSER